MWPFSKRVVKLTYFADVIATDVDGFYSILLGVQGGRNPFSDSLSIFCTASEAKAVADMWCEKGYVGHYENVIYRAEKDKVYE